MVRIIPGTPWQPGIGMHRIGACITWVLQRGAGCACLRVLHILHKVRQADVPNSPPVQRLPLQWEGDALRHRLIGFQDHC